MVTFGQKQAVKPGPFRLDAFVEQLLTELCRRLSRRLGLVVRPAVGVGHVADLHGCPLLAYGRWLAHCVRSMAYGPLALWHMADGSLTTFALWHMAYSSL